MVGEYLEHGTNHGRTAYRRAKACDGVEDVVVFLYYWDTRDGADFNPKDLVRGMVGVGGTTRRTETAR